MVNNNGAKQMTFLLVNADNTAFRKNGCTATYADETTAKRVRTRMVREGKMSPEFQVKSREQYQNDDVMVEVTSLMTNKPVMIPRSSRGTASDPSQERYWSM